MKCVALVNHFHISETLNLLCFGLLLPGCLASFSRGNTVGMQATDRVCFKLPCDMPRPIQNR